jgi:K+-sensing histidine kinase KdpD
MCPTPASRSGRELEHDPSEREVAATKIYPDIFETRESKTGLGLGKRVAGLNISVLRAIIEAHHGTIEVDHGAEGGATFAFEIPAEMT